jgi:hypothetical protein
MQLYIGKQGLNITYYLLPITYYIFTGGKTWELYVRKVNILRPDAINAVRRALGYRKYRYRNAQSAQH